MKKSVVPKGTRTKYKIWVGNEARRTGKETTTASETATERKKNTEICQDEIADKSVNSVWRDKSKDIGERRRI